MEINKISKFATAISLKVIGIIFISFLLGFAAYGLFQNLFGKENIAFTTIGLIGFALSTLLAGASIVLSISAIMLGKFSEQAMIQRSDESIRLQNEVFQKTTDALQRIESSTGVTEKRIEDIISGRVGDISYKLAEIATQKDTQQKSFKDIEEEIRKSLTKSLEQELKLTRRLSLEERRRRDEEDRIIADRKESEYQHKHQLVLSSFANRDDLKVIKTGHGSPSKTGEELFDGLYKLKSNSLIGVSTFRNEADLNQIVEFLKNALTEIYTNKISLVYLILFEENKDILIAINEYLMIIDIKFRNNIIVQTLSEDKISDFIENLELKV